MLPRLGCLAHLSPGVGWGISHKGDMKLQLSWLGFCQLPGETARFCISKGDITARGKFFKCGFLGPAPALLNQSYERVSGSQRSGLLLIDFIFLEQFLVHPQNWVESTENFHRPRLPPTQNCLPHHGGLCVTMDETTSTDSHHPESALRIPLGVGHSMGLNKCLVNGMYGCMCVKSLQLCPTLCDPVNCNPPGHDWSDLAAAEVVAAGFSLQGDSPGKNPGVGCHGLLQGSRPGDQTHVSHVSCTSRWVLHH